eukprot:scaffold31707_cov124-Isochrysis_galbana.AAC.4
MTQARRGATCADRRHVGAEADSRVHGYHMRIACHYCVRIARLNMAGSPQCERTWRCACARMCSLMFRRSCAPRRLCLLCPLSSSGSPTHTHTPPGGRRCHVARGPSPSALRSASATRAPRSTSPTLYIGDRLS